jgi:dTDP-4-dehydrorhamnose 3,5-epimerase
MTGKLIETPLSRISVAGGDVLHALKSNDSTFSGFGEAYFSWIKPGTIKAWKMHSKMTMNLVVPSGNVRFVFTQNESDSEVKFREIEIGEKNYSRITVPPNIWFGFQNRALSPSLILNLSNIEHDPSEVNVLSIDAFQFDWN